MERQASAPVGFAIGRTGKGPTLVGPQTTQLSPALAAEVVGVFAAASVLSTISRRAAGASASAALSVARLKAAYFAAAGLVRPADFAYASIATINSLMSAINC